MVINWHETGHDAVLPARLFLYFVQLTECVALAKPQSAASGVQQAQFVSQFSHPFPKENVKIIFNQCSSEHKSVGQIFNTQKSVEMLSNSIETGMQKCDLVSRIKRTSIRRIFKVCLMISLTLNLILTPCSHGVVSCSVSHPIKINDTSHGVSYCS